MALNIKNEEVDRLARQVAEATGETITEAVRVALEQRLQRERGKARSPTLREEIAAIRRRAARLPVLDPRSPDEILGYDERGMPGRW